MDRASAGILTAQQLQALQQLLQNQQQVPAGKIRYLGRNLDMTELCVYEVKDGKIISEQFRL